MLFKNRQDSLVQTLAETAEAAVAGRSPGRRAKYIRVAPSSTPIRPLNAKGSQKEPVDGVDGVDGGACLLMAGVIRNRAVPRGNGTIWKMRPGVHAGP